MDGGQGVGRISAAARRLSAPRSLRAISVGVAGVTLKWTAPKGAKPAHYLILRDGKSLGKTTRNSYTDSKVKPGQTYRYTVRALDERKRAGALSSSVRVKVPKRATPPAAPAPTTNPVAPIATVTPTPLGSAQPVPTATPTPEATPSPTATPTPEPGPDTGHLTLAMVDRMFWRAGFGPSPEQRAEWLGRSQAELVDWLLDTPLSFTPTDTPPKAGSGAAINPRVSDDELVMEWLDRMQRAVNPLPDRLAFFWHRHWATSRDDGSVSFEFAIRYRTRLLEHSDFAANPAITFWKLAYDMTTADPAMSAYLNLNANTRTKPNENYAREIMELFCLGPKGPDGTDNYTQADIEGLTRALTGWRLNTTPTLADEVTPNPDYGKITFAPNQFTMEAKTFLGKTIPAVTGSTNTTTNPASLEWGPSSVKQAIDIVLAHPNHAQFLIRKLWSEFIASPIPQATLDSLIAAYKSNAYALRPVLKGILGHPLMFESIDEPNLIKPPVIYAAGVLRQLGVPLKGGSLRSALVGMQQHPYRPPNVAGWEGGLSWLNTNTVQARFDMVVKAQYMKYSNYYRSTEVPAPAAAINYPPDVNPETPLAVFERAYAAVGSPWISDSTRQALITWAGTTPALPTNTATTRRQRFYALQAMILGGPDGQVM
jgi:uncharacterized protein (DUF1800 family)